MSTDERRPLIRDALRLPQRKATLAMLVSMIVMVVWKYFASPAYLRQFLPESAWGLPRAAWAAYLHFFLAFGLLALVPALLIKCVFREKLASYGVCWGNRRTWMSLTWLGPCFAAGGWLAASDPALRDVYPVNPHAGDSLAAFALHGAGYFVFYAAWEFHFRGFIQGALRETAGETNAILIQTMASCLLHIGKPAGETLSSIGGGLLWGIIAAQSGSIVSGLGQHFLLGIMLDAGISRPF